MFLIFQNIPMCILTFVALCGRCLYYSHFFLKTEKLRPTDFRSIRCKNLVSGFPILKTFLFTLCCINALQRMHLMSPEKCTERQPYDQQEVGVVVWRQNKKPDTCWTGQSNKDERNMNESVDTKTQGRMWSTFITWSICDLVHQILNCQDSKLYLKPKKGGVVQFISHIWLFVTPSWV